MLESSDPILNYLTFWRLYWRHILSKISSYDATKRSNTAETQLMTNHFDRLIRLLKLFNLFCGQLDINRSCEKCRKKHRHQAELEFSTYQAGHTSCPMMWCQLWVLLHLKCYAWSRYPWHLRTYRTLTGLAHNPSEWQPSHADSFRLRNFFNALDDFLGRSLGIIVLHREVSSFTTFRNLGQGPAKESTSNGGPGNRANFEPLWDDIRGWHERGTHGNIHRGLGTSRALLRGRWGCSGFALI